MCRIRTITLALLVALLCISLPQSVHALVIAGGNSHSCFITPTGEVQCVGNTASNRARLIPPPLSNGVKFIQIVAGSEFTFGILSNGSLSRGWGVLGANVDPAYPETDVRLPPKLLLEATLDNPVKRCEAGLQHMCCWMTYPEKLVNIDPIKAGLQYTSNYMYNIPLTSGFPICWGNFQVSKTNLNFNFTAMGYQMNWMTNNDPSQPVYEIALMNLKVGNTCFLLLPVSMTGNSSSVSVSSTSNSPFYNYTLLCLGDPPESVMFNSRTTNVVNILRFDDSGLKTLRILSMTCSNRVVCIILEDFSVECFGESAYAEDVVPGYKKELRCLSITSGVVHMCCLQTVLKIQCWGDLLEGAASPLPGLFSAIVSGNYHTLGVRTDSTLAFFGAQDALQSTVPLLQVSTDSLHTFALGEAFTCFIRAKSAIETVPLPPVACFGNNQAGQCDVPEDLTGQQVTAIYAGGSTVCALLSSSYPRCWGRSNHGQTIPPVGIRFSQLAISNAHVCGLELGSTYLHCWGDNSEGAVSIPQQFANIPLQSVGVTSMETCVLDWNNTISCWGTVPDYASTLPNIQYVKLGANGFNFCGLTANGTLFCRGSSFIYGEQNVPARSKWLNFAIGFYFVCAFSYPAEYVSLICFGQTGATYGRSDPPQLAYNQVFNMVAGGTHACALLKDATLSCWGNNEYGQLNLPGVYALTAPRFMYHADDGTFENCPPGTFSTGYGAATPTCSGLCLAGRYGSGNTSTATCESPCPPATYCPLGSGAPISCPPSTYAPQEGAATCTTCYETTTRFGTGCETLECQLGSELINVPTSLQSLTGSNKICSQCPAGRYSSRQGVPCSECGLDTYAPMAGMSSCYSCLSQDGISCDKGIATIDTGYFGAQDALTGKITTYKCPDQYCEGTVNTTHPTITDNDRVEAAITANTTAMSAYPVLTPIENPCSTNRLRSPDNVLCGQCTPTTRPWNGQCVENCDTTRTGPLLLLIAFSFILVYLLHRSSQNVTGAVQVAAYFIQIAMLQIRPVNQYLSWLGFFSFDVSQTTDTSCLFPLDSQYKDFSMSAAIPLLWGVQLVIIMFWHYCYFRICRKSDEDDLTVAVVAHMPNKRGSILYPRVSVEDGKPQSLITPTAPSFPWSTYLRTFIALLLISYQQISIVTIRYLNCRDVLNDRVVSAWPAISCRDPVYKSWLPLVLCLLVGDVIGLPIVIFIFLFYHRRKIWEENPGFISYFGTLTSPYKDTCYMWSAIVLVRRMIVIALSIAFAYSVDYKFLSFTYFNFFWFCISAFIQPFKRKEDNQLELFSLGIMCLISVLLLSKAPPYSDSYQIAVSVLVFVPLCAFVGWAILMIRRQIAERNQLKEQATQALAGKQQGVVEPEKVTVNGTGDSGSSGGGSHPNGDGVVKIEDSTPSESPYLSPAPTYAKSPPSVDVHATAVSPSSPDEVGGSDNDIHMMTPVKRNQSVQFDVVADEAPIYLNQVQPDEANHEPASSPVETIATPEHVRVTVSPTPSSDTSSSSSASATIVPAATTMPEPVATESSPVSPPSESPMAISTPTFVEPVSLPPFPTEPPPPIPAAIPPAAAAPVMLQRLPTKVIVVTTADKPAPRTLASLLASATPVADGPSSSPGSTTRTTTVPLSNPASSTTPKLFRVQIRTNSGNNKSQVAPAQQRSSAQL